MGQPFKLRFGPFLGEHSTLDSRYIVAPYGEESHQLRHELGALTPRYGYRRFASAPTFQGAACVSVKMFNYAASVVSNAYYEEYLTVRRHGGSYCKLFRVDATPDSGTGLAGNDKVIGKPNAKDHIDLKTATSGNCTLSFGASPTSNIAFNDTAATIQARLEALASVDPGDVTVTMTNGTTREFDVEWSGQYRGTTVPNLTINPGTLADGTGTATCTRTRAAQDYAMADSYWDCFQWDGDMYIYNYAAGDEGTGSPSDSEPLLRYTIGDLDSLTAIKPPQQRLYTDYPIRVVYGKAPAGGNAYTQIRWAGLNPAAEVTFSGPAHATDSTIDGEAFVIGHSASTTGKAKSIADMSAMTAAAQNLTDHDCFVFTITIPKPDKFQIDPESIKLFFDIDGSSEQELTVRTNYQTNSSGQITRIDCYAEFGEKTRASWASTRYVSLGYDVSVSSATASDNILRFNPITKGGITNWGAPINNQDEAFHGIFQLGYSYFNDTDDLESGVSGVLACRLTDLLGTPVRFLPNTYLGTIPYLTLYGSDDASVTDIRIYERRRITDGSNQVVMSKWRLMGSVADPAGATANFTFDFTGQDFEDATEYTPGDFKYDDIVKAKAMFGRVCYTFRRTRQNIRWTNGGSPTSLVALDGSNVDINDIERGANFSMSDNQEDTPVDFWAIGNIVLFLGQKGIHYQPGNKPALMGFPRPVNGAPGCAGRHASCPWYDRSTGTPGVAWIEPQGKQVWFIPVTSVSDLESAVGLRMLTDMERGEVERHLLRRDPDFDGRVAALNQDLKSDALWYNYSYRAMIDRRGSLIDGQRFWEHYTYGNQSGGTWSGTGWTLFSFDQDRGIKAIAPTGYIDELEYDSTNFYAPIGAEDAVPSSTSISGDTISFDEDPKYLNGQSFRASTTNGNLTSGVTRYLRVEDIGTYSIYDTLAHAQAGGATGKLNLDVEVTATIQPIGRDNGNPIQSGSIYWKGPTVNIGHEAAALRVDVFRSRMTSRPSVKLWANRNPESAARQLASGHQSVRQFPTTQGSEFQLTVYIEDNASPVFFVDQWLVKKGRRASY